LGKRCGHAKAKDKASGIPGRFNQIIKEAGIANEKREVHFINGQPKIRGSIANPAKPIAAP
jgi:hypothetical protein